MLRVLTSLLLVAAACAQLVDDDHCPKNNDCQSCNDDHSAGGRYCFWCYETNTCMETGRDSSLCHDDNCVSDRVFDSSCRCGRCGSSSIDCCPGHYTSTDGGICFPTPAPTTTAASQCQALDGCGSCLANDACYWCHETGRCNYHGEPDTPCSKDTDHCSTQPGRYAEWACDCTACGAGALTCKPGAVAGIVVGCIAGVALLITLAVCYCRTQSRKFMAQQQQQQQQQAYGLEHAVPGVPVAVVTTAQPVSPPAAAAAVTQNPILAEPVEAEPKKPDGDCLSNV